MKPAEQDICILSVFSGQLHCHVGSPLIILNMGGWKWGLGDHNVSVSGLGFGILLV